MRLLIGEVSSQSRQVGANNAERLSRGENRRRRVNDLLPCRAATPFLRAEEVKASRVLREKDREREKDDERKGTAGETRTTRRMQIEERKEGKPTKLGSRRPPASACETGVAGFSRE